MHLRREAILRSTKPSPEEQIYLNERKREPAVSHLNESDYTTVNIAYARRPLASQSNALVDHEVKAFSEWYDPGLTVTSFGPYGISVLSKARSRKIFKTLCAYGGVAAESDSYSRKVLDISKQFNARDGQIDATLGQWHVFSNETAGIYYVSNVLESGTKGDSITRTEESRFVGQLLPTKGRLASYRGVMMNSDNIMPHISVALTHDALLAERAAYTMNELGVLIGTQVQLGTIKVNSASLSVPTRQLSSRAG